MNPQQIKNIIEAALLTAGQPLSIEKLLALFVRDENIDRDAVKAALDSLQEDYQQRGIELKKVSSGFRLQVRQELADWIGRLKEDKPPRYSRALLETLALIAYRQPITRAGVEDVRGVGVSSSIIRTLLEREWIRVVGHRDVPGKPALYGTTRQFLDYFNLSSLTDLPPLAELRSIEQIQKEFDLGLSGQQELSDDQEIAVADSDADSEAPEPGISGQAEPERGEPEHDAGLTDHELAASESDDRRDENVLSASTA